MENLSASIGVSIIALSVIFLVLVILIYTIKFLEYLIPYKEPAAPPPGKQNPSGGGGPNDTLVAVITSAMASYLGQSPEQFRITNIQSK
ncbi:MAG: OadG family protein [Nitrospinaceae bacterium]